MSKQNSFQPKHRGPAGHGPMGGPPGVPGEKAKNFKGTMKHLLRYLKPFLPSVIVVLIFAVASTVFMIIGPKILGNATTEIFNGVMGKLAGTSAGINFEAVGSTLLLLLLLYLVSAVFSYLQNFLMTGVSMKLTYRFRREISEKINRLPLSYFDTRTHGEVLSRVTNDIDTVSNSLNQSLTQLITAVTSIIGVLIMMLSISWLLTLVTVIIIPVALLLVSAIVKRSQKYFIGQQRYLGEVNGHVEEMYAGHNVMKAFNGEEKSIEKFDGLNEKLYKVAWKSQFLSGLMMPVMGFVGNLGYVAVCVLGGFLAVQDLVFFGGFITVGRIAVGDIQAFIQYVRLFNQPIAQTMNIANVFQSTAAAAERVFEFLNEPEEIPEKENPVHPGEIQGHVAFKNVHFGYLPEKTIINDFSAEVEPGRKVAIVGPTGAGKTTMVKLLLRYYDVNGGAILLDGHDIRDFRRDELRDAFGMVLQDTWLFKGTIMENIRYGRLGASDEEVIAAAKAAHADHFIRTLPDGYQMEINEESSNISQGQKQLLTIARAILADPAVLILDEATSSVDTRTEVRIQKAMENLMKGRTSFIIAHRLSTIRDADIILVMRDGDIVEQGSHDELIAQNGFYATLYNSQFESAAG
ncbi:MAG: ABC transporter ATP-binding protein [Oscillospiraceae bacterium]|nr:ABC transporter ATP-binding protein [Oscillospiraceae bacterium]